MIIHGKCTTCGETAYTSCDTCGKPVCAACRHTSPIMPGGCYDLMYHECTPCHDDRKKWEKELREDGEFMHEYGFRHFNLDKHTARERRRNCDLDDPYLE